jgi:hypothetical protein
MESSPFGRLLGALVSPVKTFRSLAERPGFLLAMLVVAFVPLIPALLVLPKVDWEDVAREQIEASGVDVPAEQMEQQVEITKKIGPIATYTAPFSMSLMLLFIALVMWGAFTLAGGQPGYKRSLAVTAHAFLPFVVSQLLTIPIVLGMDSVGFEDVKTGSYLMSNLGAFAGDSTGPVAMALLSSLDVFTIWTLILLAVGFRFAAGVKATTAAFTVFGLWLVFWVGIKTGFAALGALAGGGG